MPFADSKDWDDCVKKRMADGKYTKEVAEKVCGKMKEDLEKGGSSRAGRMATGIHDMKRGKLQSGQQTNDTFAQHMRKESNYHRGNLFDKGSDIEEHEPSPVKKDLKEIGPVVKSVPNSWEFNPEDIMKSARKVTGTFHVPKIDKDNEIITKAAMGEAIPNFMHLPILHDFHRERSLGIVTKVWEEADAFHFNAVFKATPDVDDAWSKVQKGEYDHVSIFGARLKGNTSCGLNPTQRSVPCISEQIRLDSISACDTNARNDSTTLGLAKAFYTDEFNIIKALSMGSSLTHGIYDGGKKGDKMKVHEADGKDVEDEDEEEVEKGRTHDATRPWTTRASVTESRQGQDLGNSHKRANNSVPNTRFEHDKKFSKSEEEPEGSPAIREDIESKKKDFKERQAGTKRSEGEDFHGGQLEKSDELPTDEEEEFERRAHEKYGKKEVEKSGVETVSEKKKYSTPLDDSLDENENSYEVQPKKRKKGEIDKARPALIRSHESIDEGWREQRNKGIESGEYDTPDEPPKKKKEGDIEKCCEKGSLQKAKDGLKKIYGMLKHLTESDKKMVEKDKEVHDKMEKGVKDEEDESYNLQQKEQSKEEKRKVKENERRFKKGGTRPKVTEEPVDPKKKGNTQKTREDVEEVEKSRFAYNAHSGKWQNPSTVRQLRRVADQATPIVDKVANKDAGAGVANMTKGKSLGSIRFVDADKDDKKTYAEHAREESPGAVAAADSAGIKNLHKGAIRPKEGVKNPKEEKKADDKEKDYENASRNSQRHETQLAQMDKKEQGQEGKKAEVEKGFSETSRNIGVKKPNYYRSPGEQGLTEKEYFNAGHARHKRTADRSTARTVRMHEGFIKGDNMTEEYDETEEIQKANLDNEMTDEQFVLEVIQKANLKTTDEIVKAAVAAQVDEIRKGFETQIAELKAQLTKIEEQPMVKAALLIPDGSGKIEGMPLNYEAVAQFMKRG